MLNKTITRWHPSLLWFYKDNSKKNDFRGEIFVTFLCFYGDFFTIFVSQYYPPGFYHNLLNQPMHNNLLSCQRCRRGYYHICASRREFKGGSIWNIQTSKIAINHWKKKKNKSNFHFSVGFKIIHFSPWIVLFAYLTVPNIL